MAKKAIIAGSSGLIGSKLLDILLQEAYYDEVLILIRKELNIQHKKLTQLVVNFDQPETYAQYLTGHAVFSSLGSTKLKTPNLKIYRKIDHDYPLQLAQLAYANGVNQFHLVSSLGANASASNFYFKMKAEIEEDIKAVGLQALHIYRPAFLTGDRQEKRPVEKVLSILSKVIDPLLIGGLRKYRSIPAKTVAMAMYKQSIKNMTGVFIYPSEQIKQLS